MASQVYTLIEGNNQQLVMVIYMPLVISYWNS